MNFVLFLINFDYKVLSFPAPAINVKDLQLSAVKATDVNSSKKYVERFIRGAGRTRLWGLLIPLLLAEKILVPKPNYFLWYL